MNHGGRQDPHPPSTTSTAPAHGPCSSRAPTSLHVFPQHRVWLPGHMLHWGPETEAVCAPWAREGHVGRVPPQATMTLPQLGCHASLLLGNCLGPAFVSDSTLGSRVMPLRVTLRDIVPVFLQTRAGGPEALPISFWKVGTSLPVNIWHGLHMTRGPWRGQDAFP